MNKYVFYPEGINDFEKKFNAFIESNLSIEIRSIDFTVPFINHKAANNKKLMVSIVYS